MSKYLSARLRWWAGRTGGGEISNDLAMAADQIDRLSRERDATSRPPVGWSVLVKDHGHWTVHWDTSVHPTREEASKSWQAAVEYGWDAIVVGLTRDVATPKEDDRD